MKPPNRTAVLMMVAVILCGAIVAGHTVFHSAYGLQSCAMAYNSISCLAFVMAFVALGRRGKG